MHCEMNWCLLKNEKTMSISLKLDTTWNTFLFTCTVKKNQTSLCYIFVSSSIFFLEKAMAPHSSTLAWKILWTEEPGRLQSMGSLRVAKDTTERLHFDFSLSCIGEGNGNPHQCSFLENPRDGGASWAALYGVAQSRTWLKRLSSSSSSSITQCSI